MATAMRVPQIAFTLQVKVTIDAKDRDSFVKHFKTAYDLAVAEPECAYFLVGENVQEPGAFYWTEGWTKDIEWFMTEQITKSYYEPYIKATEPLYTTPRVVVVCSPLGSMNHIRADLLALPNKV